MTKQAETKALIGSHVTGAAANGDTALADVNFYFRVLYDRYVDCLKRVLRRHGLDDLVRPGFGYVFFALYEEEELRPSEICRRTGLKSTTMTAIVDQMVKKGLVDRRPDPDDRRAIQLRLLPKSKKIREANYQVLEELSETVCRDISKKDLRTAKRVMRQMIMNMAGTE